MVDVSTMTSQCRFPRTLRQSHVATHDDTTPLLTGSRQSVALLAIYWSYIEYIRIKASQLNHKFVDETLQKLCNYFFFLILPPFLMRWVFGASVQFPMVHVQVPPVTQVLSVYAGIDWI